MQTLGGRYEHPECSELEDIYWLSVLDGARSIVYWKYHCGDIWPDCYNAGWKAKKFKKLPKTWICKGVKRRILRAANKKRKELENAI
jgi:hypothetical protein